MDAQTASLQPSDASTASLAARYLDARRPPDALGSLRARSALVAILAALARPTVDEDYVSGKRRTDDDDYCAGLCWHLCGNQIFNTTSI